MAKTNQKVTTATKEKAVKFIMEHVRPNLTKKESEKQFLKVAKQFGLSKTVLKHAYENKLNFNKVDLRKKSGRKNKNINWAEIRSHANTELAKQLYSFPVKKLTTKEMKLLLHEYLFGTKKRISEFLQEKEINKNQWYDILRNIKIPGKIGNSKVFDFTKYAKPVDMNIVFKYAKEITRSHGNLNKPLSQSSKAKIKCLSKLTKKDELIVRRLVKVLYFYSIPKNSSEAKTVAQSMQGK